ncbi:Type 1 glutamine amidotransferase-like domain-containing protein [Ensifer sp. ENS10]|uniref:Type 1 glutamine amidotransferase-like domain-containing protein n=1 Tax=Ensifer sp. ENS10 TaxID=2769286 RepID=UPI001FEDA04B|nr:Type 1 glutamine amidotransferase-like domain-containing protein [Ensifer sp. ENS10]
MLRYTPLDLALFYDLDEPHSAEDIAALFASDAIHLSGGHTGGFLERLKQSRMLGPIRDWALAGGILIGVSAGAILMAPTITTDALFIGLIPEDMAGSWKCLRRLGRDAASPMSHPARRG